MARPDLAAERAAEQAESRRVRSVRRAAIEEQFEGSRPGSWWIGLDLAATAVFLVAGVVGAIWYRPLGSSWHAWPAALTSLVLFVAGCVLFLVALVDGARRSRRSILGIGGWFLLSGSAPRSIQRRLNGALAAQVVGGLGCAAARPFTALAFATLAPVFGLGINGIWSARHGWFPDRSGQDGY